MTKIEFEKKNFCKNKKKNINLTQILIFSDQGKF